MTLESPPGAVALEEENADKETMLDRAPWYTVPGILLGVPFLSWLLSLAAPHAFGDKIIWRYFWGPIVADATDGVNALTRNGIVAEAGYNIWNTAAWAVLLAVCIFGIAQMLHRFNQPMDAKLILGATAWVIPGSTWHVLQDTGLFKAPVEYIFITPPIYLLFGAFGILAFLLGQYAKYISEQTGSYEDGLQKIWFTSVIVVLAYTVVWLAEWNKMVHIANPIWIAVFAVLNFAILRNRVVKTGRIDPSEVCLILPLAWLLAGFLFVYQYMGNPWPGTTPDDDLQYAIYVAPGLALAAVAAVWVVAKQLVKRGKANAAVYLVPINLVLIWSQMLDGFATAIGIDLSSYSEKHVLSEGVRRFFESFYGRIGWEFGAEHPTFLGFAVVKLLISIMVVWVIDVSSKEDAIKWPTMVGLVKFAVIMVGIGPGFRNMLRMALGV